MPTLYPVPALHALRAGRGDAWRLWALAHAVDIAGSGRVLGTALRQAAYDLGVNRQNYDRFLRKAKSATYLQPYKHKGQTWYALRSTAKLAYLVGCDTIGRKAHLEIAKLFTKRSWRMHVWDAYLATTREKPISRERMRQITRVPESTQRKYEKELETVKIPHYAHDEVTTPDHLPMLQEYSKEEGGRPHAFIYHDHKTNRKLIAWRLPDSRKAHTLEARKGRARKVSKDLKRLQVRQNSLFLERVAVPLEEIPTYPVRLFHHTQATTEKAIRYLDRLDRLDIKQLYTFKPGGHTCVQHTVTNTI